MRASPARTISSAALAALAALATPSALQAQGATDPTVPLDASALAIIDAIPSEQIPEPEEHYPTSNEWRHDLFFDAGVRDLGGAFVGVGTDQCYTLAAAQNAALVWIVDYDAIVPRVHRMYGVLVGASPTAAELLARFDAAHEAETVALLESALAGAPDAAEVVRAYRRNRGRFAGYLRHVARLERDGRPTSWLSDPVLYARTRALFANGRIVARTGDVTGATTLRAVGAASQQLGVPVRVLYFSNAEQFFPYSTSFGENVRALPTEERSIVLRTFRHRRASYPDGDTWHYMIETLPDFVERLALGYRRNTQIVSDAIRAGLGATGVTQVGPATPRQYARAIE